MIRTTIPACGSVLLPLLLTLSCTGRNPEAVDSSAMGPAPTHAVCVLRAIGDSKVEGLIEFERRDGGIRVHGRVSGLEPGKHGFHVHEFGDLRDAGTGKSAGGHFAPEGQPHGRPSDAERHVGDLGNIEANAEGVATVDITDDHIALAGPHSIVGRALVVHAGEDTFDQPTGSAGPRVAFGVIAIAGGGQSGEEDSGN